MPPGHLAEGTLDVFQQAARAAEDLEEAGIELPGR
jgi:hypothetical protein